MGLIDELKAQVNILTYIETDAGCRAEKCGGGKYRVSPCPICNHNDCCTIYVAPDKTSFNCFSCKNGGTIIDYEMLRHNFSEPGEAAKSIAAKIGFSSSDDSWRQKHSYKNNKEYQEPEEKPFTRRLTDARAAELRSIAADFYHAELLNNKEAYEKQTLERGHSLEILTAFRVGYVSSNSLIKHIQETGFDVEDLLEIGLAAENKKGGYRNYVCEGSFIYPQTVSDDVVFFTIKTPDSKKNYQVKKMYARKDWLCFNQDVLSDPAKPLWIVEGENDLLSVADKGKYKWVVGTNGNYNATSLSEWIKENCRGKKYYLCFDNDDAGKKYEKLFGDAISFGEGTASIINLPEEVNDIDDYLRGVDDPENALKDLMLSSAEYEFIDDPDEYIEGDDHYESVDLDRFPSFSVLGEMEDTSIVFQSNDIQKIYQVNIRDITLEKMCQVGGEVVAKNVARSEKDRHSWQIHFMSFRKRIVLEARKRQLGPLHWIGQGVSYLDSGRLLIVNGAEAFIWDESSIQEYKPAVIENKMISRQSYATWIDTDTLINNLLDMDDTKARAAIEELYRIIKQWGFQGRHDAELVTGFVVAQMVQTVWSWRPHMWLSGPAGSGKTTLLHLLNELGDKLSIQFEGSSTTEPGFRQGIGRNFCLAAIDEFEKSPDREKTIALLRTAGRGGFIMKGSTTGQGVEYFLRHMVVVASIETSLARAAEKSRFIVIEHVKNDQLNPQQPMSSQIRDLRNRLFAAAIYLSLKCRRLIAKMKRIEGQDPRMAEAYAVPLSILSILDQNPEDMLHVKVGLTLEDHIQHHDDMPEDEESILDAILNSTVRVSISNGEGSVYAERSIHWLLNSSSQIHKDDAQACGVWELKDGSLFFATDIIMRKLLRDTIWKEHNINGILKRLEGVSKWRAKYNGTLYRGLKYEDHGLINPEEPSNEQIPMYAYEEDTEKTPF